MKNSPSRLLREIGAAVLRSELSENQLRFALEDLQRRPLVLVEYLRSLVAMLEHLEHAENSPIRSPIDSEDIYAELEKAIQSRRLTKRQAATYLERFVEPHERPLLRQQDKLSDLVLAFGALVNANTVVLARNRLIHGDPKEDEFLEGILSRKP